jgi:hypothetical protein
MLAAASIAPAVILTACGGDGSDVPDDERARQVTGIAELAANAYAAVGPEGLYDYLAARVAADCSMQGLAQALAGEPVPEGFVRVAAVTFDGDSARATVVQRFGEEERESEWSFVEEDESRWRITHVPGLEGCTS